MLDVAFLVFSLLCFMMAIYVMYRFCIFRLPVNILGYSYRMPLYDVDVDVDLRVVGVAVGRLGIEFSCCHLLRRSAPHGNGVE